MESCPTGKSTLSHKHFACGRDVEEFARTKRISSGTGSKAGSEVTTETHCREIEIARQVCLLIDGFE